MIKKNKLSDNSEMFCAHLIRNNFVEKQKDCPEKNEKIEPNIQEMLKLSAEIYSKKPAALKRQKSCTINYPKDGNFFSLCPSERAKKNDNLEELKKSVSLIIEKLHSAHKPHLSDYVKHNYNTINPYSSKKAIEGDDLEELKKSVSLIIEKMSSVRKGKKNHWSDGIRDNISTFNFYPSRGAKEYLKKAKYSSSVKVSLSNDWNKVSADMWISYAKILLADKSVK